MSARTLTAQQQARISQTIRDHHLAFMAEVLGPESIPKADYDRLKKAGKIREKKVMPATDAATAAHVLGTITGELPAEEASKITGGSFWSMLKEAPPAITATEREAAQIARDRIGQHIAGLGNKLDTATGHILIEADDKLRKKKLMAVRTEISRGIEERLNVKEIASKLKQATGDVKRNWLQIAQTEVHNAVEEGKAVALVKTLPEGEKDPLVFKRPRKDACPFCVLLYLQPDKKTPRVFRLSDLIANGVNVGRKANRPLLKGPRATEWKAVLGAMHPWCGCTLHHLPAGMGFDADGLMVYVGTKKAIEVESLNKAYADHQCEGHGH